MRGVWRAAGALWVCLGMAACGGGGSDLGSSSSSSSSSSSGGSSSSSSSSSSGGSSSSSGVTANNVVAVVVDSGPNGQNVNTLFTTVTICVPGSTTQCQTIDHIQVDTASYGFRVLSSELSLSLPGIAASNGNALAECVQFVDGYSWGSIVTADLKISGEAAASIPVQIIGDGKYTVPTACANSGTAENTVAQFGANGIIGIGVFKQDCASGCANNASNGFYYSCTAGANGTTGTCTGSTAPLTSQVLNPIPFFATDNNGSFVVLPSISSAGAATVTGSLIFGIDTQSNNASGSESVITVDPNQGYFTATYAGTSLPQSFVDTGSNALYFDDSNITKCTSSNYSGFYCPGSTLNLSATITGQNSVTATVSFSIASAQSIDTANPSFTALPLLAGTYSSASSSSSTTTPVTFDFGLPFFFGRRVAAAIEGSATAVATGPYVAF